MRRGSRDRVETGLVVEDREEAFSVEGVWPLRVEEGDGVDVREDEGSSVRAC